MNQTETGDTGQEPQRRHRRHRMGHGLVPTLVLATVLLLLAGLALSGRDVPLPAWAQDRVAAAVNARLGDGRVDLGDVSVALERDGTPSVVLRNIFISDPSGGVAAVLNGVRARLSLGSLLQGRLSPEGVELDGAQVTLRRLADGRFAFETGAGDTRGRNLGDLIGLLDRVLNTELLRPLREVAADGVVIAVEDARTGRIWQATGATLLLRRTEAGLTLSVASDVFSGTDEVAEVQLSFDFDDRTRATSLGVRVSDVPARDIAAQSPVLAWLGVLDAPISGAVRADYAADSGLTSLAGTLDIGKGALNPVEGSEPLEFDTARAYFEFDAGRQRIDFSEIAVASSLLRLDATGQIYLSDMASGWPSAYVGQIVVGDARIEPLGIFEGPLENTGLRADLRLRLDPFTVEFGQVAATSGETTVRGRGRVEARSDGWHLAVDAETARILPQTVMAHWPVVLAPKTRKWLSRNVLGGVMRDVAMSVRKRPGAKPDLALSFDFEEASVRFLDHMPPVTGGRGRGSIFDRRFSLVLDEGGVVAGAAGQVDGAGSVLVVPDMREEPARGTFRLVTRGPIRAGLAILDNPPVRLMQRAGRAPDIATGRAELETRLELPLRDRLGHEDVRYEVTGTLRDVRSERIVKDRVLEADQLTLAADPGRIEVDGSITLDGVPITATWSQPLGPGARETGGRVVGHSSIGPDVVEAFELPLPEGLLTGQGHGAFELTLKPGEPPHLDLTSDLKGVGMALPAVGWRKAPAATGAFELSASLDTIAVVERLALSAPGLALEGRLFFTEGNLLREAVFDQLRLGRWFDGKVRLTPRGAGRSPAIAVEGGVLDLRDFTAPTSERGGERGPVTIALDRVIVTDGITLTPVRGQLDPGRAGLSGTFQARVDGRTPIAGTLAPANAGTAIRVQSNDAGGVLRDAGLTPSGREGTLDLVLTPVVGAPGGTYDGQFLIEDFRLRGAPLLAGLLDAISVVGLLDQLAGPGIRFETVDGKLALTPGRISLRDVAAVGPSLGISANGVYDRTTRTMDIAGVVSPVYFLNAIGQIFSRRGEGLFGFNYRMIGPIDAPRIQVNPLSILTPGMFREIFRSRPPGE